MPFYWISRVRFGQIAVTLTPLEHSCKSMLVLLLLCQGNNAYCSSCMKAQFKEFSLAESSLTAPECLQRLGRLTCRSRAQASRATFDEILGGPHCQTEEMKVRFQTADSCILAGTSDDCTRHSPESSCPAKSSQSTLERDFSDKAVSAHGPGGPPWETRSRLPASSTRSPLTHRALMFLLLSLNNKSSQQSECALFTIQGNHQ
ncbi:unnamed protein product [Leuciscus chuanchicus]